MQLIEEITPLRDQDCFYVVARHKDAFTYPLHTHAELELNFVENCEGALRIVGDSQEELGAYDLVLIGSGLEHCWEQHKCTSQKVEEITIQFSPELLGRQLLEKSPMASIQKLLERSHRGLAFGAGCVMRIYGKLQELRGAEPGFYRFIKLLEILYELSLEEDCHELSSERFAHAELHTDSRRVHRVIQYIDAHFKDDVRLQTLADIATMAPTAFCRFFKLRTGKTLSEYLLDVRIGHAAHQLAHTTDSVIEICYDSGFNNVSNFNRLFKKRKGCTPTEFREHYRK